MRLFNKIGLSLVDLYRVCLSPFKCPCCRFTPTCSAYAKEALQKCGFLTAIVLIFKRILRCHPWGGCGYDPVPVQKYRKEK